MTPQTSLRTTHLLLGVQSLVVILLSINRLSSLTTGYVAPNEFLRWVDLNNMLILPLISTVAFYLLIKQMEIPGLVSTGSTGDFKTSERRLSAMYPSASKPVLALNLLFIVGVYLLAASYGDHEVTNYLHTRFCNPDNGTDLCRIVIFNDDEFSHWVFFTGFVLINVGVMLYQIVFPYPAKIGRGDAALLIGNGVFIGLGVFANLAFEVIGLDLYVVALLAALSFFLFWRRGAQPLFLYYSTAYGLGLVGTFLYKVLA